MHTEAAGAGSGADSTKGPRKPESDDQHNTPIHAERLDNAALADRLDQIAKRAGNANTRDAIAEAAIRLRALGATGVAGNVAEADAAGNVPRWLDSTVHLHREVDGVPQLHVVKGGCLVSQTDLTADEIDELTAMRVIRFATPAELRATAKPAADGK